MESFENLGGAIAPILSPPLDLRVFLPDNRDFELPFCGNDILNVRTGLTDLIIDEQSGCACQFNVAATPDCLSGDEHCKLYDAIDEARQIDSYRLKDKLDIAFEMVENLLTDIVQTIFPRCSGKFEISEQAIDEFS